MDSDDDGAYGYDIPEDSGKGFRLSAMKTPESDDDSLDNEKRKFLGSSSDEGDDQDFSYGAYGKRRRGNEGVEKERNLYGVFYDSDSENEGRLKKKRGRQFERGQNRQAGLAFVKASESSGETNKSDVASDDSPWLKEEEVRKQISADIKDRSTDQTKNSAVDVEDNNGTIDDEEIQQLSNSEERFHKLLKTANTAKHQLSFTAFRKKQCNKKFASQEAAASKSCLDTNNSLDIDNKLPVISSGPSFISSASDGNIVRQSTAADIRTVSEKSMPDSGLDALSSVGPSVQDSTHKLDQTGSTKTIGMGSELNHFSITKTMMGMHDMGMDSASTAKKRDPTLGKWEKHTKGIGLKLLSKMGYEGSGGLGAKRRRKPVATLDKAATENSISQQKRSQDHEQEVGMATGLGFKEILTGSTREEGKVKRGISRPVEVVVRPAGLGLGFGSFKEASQLKANRQIEAEVRGLDLELEESKKDTNKDEGIYDKVPKSLLPSTDSLLSKGSQRWRRSTKKKTKPKIINYKDIIKQSTDESVKVIDMRGPSLNQNFPTTQTTVLLGEELLHNVTLLLSTHENQLCTASYMMNTTQKKIESLEAERQEIKQRSLDIKNRIDKMTIALEVIDEAESLNKEIPSIIKDKQMSSVEMLDHVMQYIQTMITKLNNNFNAEEKKSLKIDSTFIPSIVKPPIDMILSSVDPFGVDNIWMSRLSSGIKHCCNSTNSNACFIRHTILLNCIISWVEIPLSLSNWDNVIYSESGLHLYERLLTLVDDSFSDLDPTRQLEESNIVKESFNEQLMIKVVFPKLQRFVCRLKPKLDDQGVVTDPMHLKILPWLPHFSHDLLATILDEVRRKLKTTITLIGKSDHKGFEYFNNCMRVFQPWAKLFEGKVFYAISSDTVTPRFAQSLSRTSISSSTSEQDWSLISILFQYFENEFISSDDFISLIEGELLPAWANTLYFDLKKKGTRSMIDIKAFYIAWKSQLMSFTTDGKLSKGSLVLRSESMICRYFFGGLEMIQAALESSDDLLDSLQPQNPLDCNYRISLMRRAKAAAAKNEEIDVANDDAKSTDTVRIGGKKIVPFQEVVAEFAKHHDIEFFPKTGYNSTKDGKPVFMLGTHPVYFDKNVIFVLRGGRWGPISLEHLVQSC